jgi:hypothetical protein
MEASPEFPIHFLQIYSIGDAVIATDSQGRMMFMNSVAAALTG